MALESLKIILRHGKRVKSFGKSFLKCSLSAAFYLKFKRNEKEIISIIKNFFSRFLFSHSFDFLEIDKVACFSKAILSRGKTN